MLPRLGQQVAGGQTDSQFHEEHPDWPKPNGEQLCGCEPPEPPEAPEGGSQG